MWPLSLKCCLAGYKKLLVLFFFRCVLSYLDSPSAGNFCVCHFCLWGKIIHSLAALVETWTWSWVCRSGRCVKRRRFFTVSTRFLELKVVSTQGDKSDSQKLNNRTDETIAGCSSMVHVFYNLFEQTTTKYLVDALTGAVFSSYRPTRFTDRWQTDPCHRNITEVSIGKYCQFIIIFKILGDILTYISPRILGDHPHAPPLPVEVIAKVPSRYYRVSRYFFTVLTVAHNWWYRPT